MARIAGVNIPTSKRVPIALTYITGIGPASAEAICGAVGIELSRASIAPAWFLPGREASGRSPYFR